jgi:hypothetical protein
MALIQAAGVNNLISVISAAGSRMRSSCEKGVKMKKPTLWLAFCTRLSCHGQFLAPGYEIVAS